MSEHLRLQDVVGWLIRTLTSWARDRVWGQITITVQAGQIVVMQETRTHKSLPRESRADTAPPPAPRSDLDRV